MPAAASTMPPKVEPAVSGRWIQPPGSIDDLRSKVLRALREGGDKPTDLAGIRLVGEDLAGCDLSGCDLTGADLSRADLTGARLIGANLSAATLHQTKLDEAELAGATLLGATLEGASAKRAGFGKADLRRTSFFGATLDGNSPWKQANLKSFALMSEPMASITASSMLNSFLSPISIFFAPANSFADA